jgi:hypothetical protein
MRDDEQESEEKKTLNLCTKRKVGTNFLPTYSQKKKFNFACFHNFYLFFVIVILEKLCFFSGKVKFKDRGYFVEILQKVQSGVS